ncbi:PTS glucose/sucrose transporter subunit IIB [Nanchangia anserum]|uniref:PTS glucose/sucrose transporter subunit IIB n=1 Tax=Nanchangia anserum TaxID=2692125 RepID=A0A8I0GB29_9ACTO|nr:PTS glucose/sucrose transporter subunit IIB [Nanchangia anserum]MBD3688885.1 PTS glucose/sucrose transporter subunit IIB [Nanchangia anserum]QOX81152.1 PTS glucose/sucrose transporter subunit IIB [Nanchangia anserum]
MDQAQGIITGLGGGDNIVELEPCITRLRVEVKDPDKVSESALTEAGAFGVVQVGDSVQVVVGPIADNLADAIEDILG